jgi:choline-glycine betaine transporter
VIFEGIRLLVPGRPIGLFLEIVEIVGIVGTVTIVKRSLGYGLLRLNNSTLFELI